MLQSLITWSARNRFLVLILTLGVTLAGIYAAVKTPLDALPDLSDVQVIVYTEYSGQAPQVVEDQITYPLTTAMLSVPKSKVVRGFSFFGASFVYVIFEDGTDIYWARSRVLESLNFARDRLPKGVEPKIGPDATGVGWVYQYVLFPGWYCLTNPPYGATSATPGTLRNQYCTYQSLSVRSCARSCFPLRSTSAYSKPQPTPDASGPSCGRTPSGSRPWSELRYSSTRVRAQYGSVPSSKIT